MLPVRNAPCGPRSNGSTGEAPRLVAEALELARLPGVKIELSGDEGCHQLYEVFIALTHGGAWSRTRP